mgnify:CR=1 FL=1
MKEKLIDRMVHIYGFENPIVIEFCRMCDRGEIIEDLLDLIVELHEKCPQLDEDEEDA